MLQIPSLALTRSIWLSFLMTMLARNLRVGVKASQKPELYQVPDSIEQGTEHRLDLSMEPEP